MLGIIDYGMGNLQSVRNSCEYLGEKPQLVAAPEALAACTKLILPGVGSFAEGMKNLRASGLEPPLREAVSRGVPLLGICLGMQLLADQGTEGGDTAGLGFIAGTVKRFELKDLRIPHVGWNNIMILRDNPLFTPEMAVDYYFVHSYFFEASENADIVATCDYGRPFPCVVGRGRVFGVQFHPEKSHAFGLRILKNFFTLEPCLKNG